MHAIVLFLKQLIIRLNTDSKNIILVKCNEHEVVCAFIKVGWKYLKTNIP